MKAALQSFQHIIIGVNDAGKLDIGITLVQALIQIPDGKVSHVLFQRKNRSKGFLAQPPGTEGNDCERTRKRDQKSPAQAPHISG